MQVTRRQTLAGSVLLALMTMTGCVATSVTSRPIGPMSHPAERLLIVVKGGTFKAQNIASNLGQRNLDKLAPSLVRRLPVVFEANGLPSRTVDTSSADAAALAVIKAQPRERVLLLTPYSATYSSKTGQELFLNAQLMNESGAPTPIWQADIRLATMGFGQFDDKLANEIATQLLDRLRTDRVAVVAAGTLRTE